MEDMSLGPDWSFHIKFMIPRSEKNKHVNEWRSVAHATQILPGIWLEKGKVDKLYIVTQVNGNPGFVIKPSESIKFGKWQALQIGRERVKVKQQTKFRVYAMLNGKRLDLDFRDSVDGGFVDAKNYTHVGEFFCFWTIYELYQK